MSDTVTQEAVLVERRDHVTIVTINRPEVRNAVNSAVHMGVGTALKEADNDPNTWVVIITGAGDKAFCAGADLKAMSRGEMGQVSEEARAWGFAGYVMHHISKPTIAAVNGFALGGGTELTLASDLAVASENAMFGLPEVKRGIIAAAGGAFRIGRQLPRKIAMEMLLTGDPITARRAHELGLVNQVVPEGQALEAALKLAERIAVNAPLAVQASKRIAAGIAEGKIASEADSWALNSRESGELRKSEDAKEGPLAFAEKRAPVWKAR
ncbi:MAG: crotonase/enoyl-CoA hydratase family protein [Phenylobacterium sp.]